MAASTNKSLGERGACRWRIPGTAWLVVLGLLFLVQAGPALGQTAQEIEEVFWQSVVCERAEEVRLYLETYPNGAYVAEAWACLEGQLGLDRTARILVQQGLAALDYAPGPVDGQFGLATRRAIRAWQEAKEFAATGYLTQEQAEALMTQGRDAVAAVEAARERKAEEERQRAEAERQAREADDAAYAEAQRVDTAAAYGDYLAAYPGGRHATEAQTRQQARAETERLAQLPRELRNSLGMEFVLIEPGTFLMGSPATEPGRDDDETLHQVTLSRPYYLGKYEVTQGQWQAVMGSNPSWYSSCGGTCPVDSVFWEDAQEFITALNQQERVGTYRLPTEAEWEYAARAGTQTAYHFGNAAGDLELYAWYDGRGLFFDEGTRPVGQKQPNEWGLYDMHGNVWEWVADWYGGYPVGSVTNPRGPRLGTHRVRRGGGWAFSARACRAAYRGAKKPFSDRSTHSHDGFRLARSP